MDFKLEDSTSEKIPNKLEDIIKHIKNRKTSTNSLKLFQGDIFVGLIFYMMQENGFVPVIKKTEKYSSESNMDIDQLSIPILNEGKCEIEFLLTGFSDISVKMILCPLGATILVNVLVTLVNSDVYSICLPISKYVVSPEASIASVMFSDLKQLSHVFRNDIVTPVKSSILNYYGYSSASLLGLPEELLFKIFLILPINYIINISKTCRRLHLLLENPSLWHKLYIRDFKKEIIDEEQNWKNLYKEAYVTQQESKRIVGCRTGTLHDLMDISDFVSYIDNPMWDVVI